jgi:hypothetical protein
MTLDIWARAEEEAAAKRAEPVPPRPAVPVTASDVREIPRPCSCTWKPSYATLPATWALTQADPQCRLHGNQDGEAA